MGGVGSATAAEQLGMVSPGSTTKAQFQLKQTGILILPNTKAKDMLELQNILSE